MNNEGIVLYEVKKNVRCTKCGHKGAIQNYGKWYPRGLGERAADLPAPYNEYKDQPKMSRAVGFGGTIPWKCTNCGNVGLIDFGGLEGYDMAFKTTISDSPQILELLSDMLFAYVNKDNEIPHDFEIETINKVCDLLIAEHTKYDKKFYIKVKEEINNK